MCQCVAEEIDALLFELLFLRIQTHNDSHFAR